MSELPDNEYREQRIDNMRELEKMGYNPFGSAFERTGRLTEIRASFEEEKHVSAAGSH